MYFSYGPKSSWLLLFFIHAVVLGLMLVWHYGQHGQRSSLWLAAIAGVGAAYIAPFMLGYAAWYSRDGYREVLFYLPWQQVLLIGPVFHRYVQTLLNPGSQVRRKDLLHFAPALLYTAYTLAMWVWDVVWPGTGYFYADGRDRDFDSWYQVAGLLSQGIYFGLSLRLYWRYRSYTFESLSFAEAVQYRWLLRFLVAFLALLVLRVLFFVINPEWGEFGRKFWYYLSFSGLLYAVLTLGFGHAWRMTNPIGHRAVLPNLPAAKPKEAPTMPASELATWKKRLEAHMSVAKAYLHPTLTLTEVAQALHTTPKQISAVVNQGFGLNFNDYVNGLRVEAMVEQLKEGKHEQSTLLGLALDCGFNSKSTFNRAFKKHTDRTPKEFLDQLGAK